MHYSNIVLGLLAAGATAPAVEAAFVPRHGQRATHIARDFFPPNRFVSSPNARAVNGTVAGVKKTKIASLHKRRAKHTIKKKRAAGKCAARTSTTASLSSDTTVASASSNATIGGIALVNPSSAASIAFESETVASSAAATTSASASTTVWWTAESSAAAATSSAAAASSASATATEPLASTTVASAAASASASSSSTWFLTDKWSGASFFDNWSFFNYDDPTHGDVEYVARGQAWDEHLIEINSAGNPVMRVETTEQVSGNRKSVRIHGNKVFTGGLVLMDALHMPFGCGTWPAWWSNGPNWPYGGEIDILEGVNAFTENQVSLHTGDGCTMPSWTESSMSGQFTTGSFDSLNCASYATSNQGCGVRAVGDETTLGSGFNSVNGGVYALKWDKTGISAWFFPRASIPADITDDKPEPSGWGTPMANFPSTSCSPYEFFKDHFSIFDTTLCGDWAGADAVWNYAGYAGQSQSCAALTGYSTCSDYIKNKGSALTDAYWEVQYVKYFNSTTEL